jgi:hypothetical protein
VETIAYFLGRYQDRCAKDGDRGTHHAAVAAYKGAPPRRGAAGDRPLARRKGVVIPLGIAMSGRRPAGQQLQHRRLR